MNASPILVYNPIYAPFVQRIGLAVSTGRIGVRFLYGAPFYASIAQQEEHSNTNREAEGSTPSGRANFP